MLSVVAELTQAEAILRAALLDVESYEISLDLSTDAETVSSLTVIRFSCRAPGASSFADLTATLVRRVTLNGEPLDPSSAITAGRLQLPELAASNELIVEAEVAYWPDGSGLQRFSDPADSAAYVMARCFSAFASRLFCCFDQPDLRADISLSVLAPAGWEVIANGAVTDRPANGAAGLWRFVAVPALKPYELALCAGPYVTAVEQIPSASTAAVTVRCRRSLANSPGLSRVADVVSTVIDFYARFLGIPCPYDKVDVTFAPDLGPLAMQLPAATYANEILLDRVARAENEFVTVVLAHEVAHLWFGCLVEGRWWDDLWLAEAMATYLSY